MTFERLPKTHDNTIYGDDAELTYSVDTIAEIVGVNSKTVLHYQKLGVIAPATEGAEFDVEMLRRMARLESLREQHQLTDSALCLIHSLLAEIEQLRDERRQLFR